MVRVECSAVPREEHGMGVGLQHGRGRSGPASTLPGSGSAPMPWTLRRAARARPPALMGSAAAGLFIARALPHVLRIVGAAPNLRGSRPRPGKPAQMAIPDEHLRAAL